MFATSGKMQATLLAAILALLAVVFLVMHTVKHDPAQSVSAATVDTPTPPEPPMDGKKPISTSF